jgi:hypothetical protein
MRPETPLEGANSLTWSREGPPRPQRPQGRRGYGTLSHLVECGKIDEAERSLTFLKKVIGDRLLEA